MMKDMMRKLVVTVIGLCMVVSGFAQDPTFMNHNISPFSLNPALIGNSNAYRFGLNYRKQWPDLDNTFSTVRVSYDQNIYKRMCSFGGYYVYDTQGQNDLTTHEFALGYGHTMRLAEQWGTEYFIRLGLTGSFFMKQYGNYTFSDQYDPVTGTAPGNTSEDFESSTSFLDFGFGAAFVISNMLTVGASVMHIGEPFSGIVEEQDEVLHRRYTVHASYVRDLESSNGLWGRTELSDKSLFVNANFQYQEPFYKTAYISGGVMISPIIGGVAYKRAIDGGNNAVSFILGGTYKGLQAYGVYDLNTASKGNGSYSYEFTFVYIYQRHERYPCPVVYW